MKKAKLLNQRRKYGFTQNEVAHCLGITASSYCRVENGQTLLSEHILLKLCHLYDCNIDELIEITHCNHNSPGGSEVDYARLYACIAELYLAQQQRLDHFHE